MKQSVEFHASWWGADDGCRPNERETVIFDFLVLVASLEHRRELLETLIGLVFCEWCQVAPFKHVSLARFFWQRCAELVSFMLMSCWEGKCRHFLRGSRRWCVCGVRVATFADEPAEPWWRLPGTQRDEEAPGGVRPGALRWPRRTSIQGRGWGPGLPGLSGWDGDASTGQPVKC